MTIINLADHYSVWTKSTIIELLEALGDSDFQRSQSKPELIECLHNYFVPDVLSVTELKSLSQLDRISTEYERAGPCFNSRIRRRGRQFYGLCASDHEYGSRVGRAIGTSNGYRIGR